MKGSGVGLQEIDTADPVALAPGEAITFALAVEGRRCPLQEGGVDVLERIDADHCVCVTVDRAGDDRDDAAGGTDVELGCLCSEGIYRDVPGIPDADGQ